MNLADEYSRALALAGVRWNDPGLQFIRNWNLAARQRAGLIELGGSAEAPPAGQAAASPVGEKWWPGARVRYPGIPASAPTERNTDSDDPAQPAHA